MRSAEPAGSEDVLVGVTVCSYKKQRSASPDCGVRRLLSMLAIEAY
jgi:hypothetical protein